MFVQVVQGQVGDRELLARQMEAWRTDVKPGAVGYQGSTGGVTADGRAIVMARFESQEAAQANSDRPEQGAWWSQTAEAFSGEVSFHDCAEVDLMAGGGSNDAGFVQVMQGRVTDQEAMRRLVAELEPALRTSRPDVIGSVCAWHGDGGGFTQAIYFTSEAAAREGEEGMADDESARSMMELIDGELTFFDLSDPYLD